MKIVKIEDLHADGGWANLSFLKITTDEGIVGWAECTQFFGAQGLMAVIRNIGEQLIGKDPREIGKIGALLYAQTRIATGGLNSQALAAIENACLDIKAKSLGVPVVELLGGAQRDRLEVYWSHVGMYRLRYADIFEKMKQPVLREFDDFAVLGKEVVKRGFRGMKTNIIVFDGGTPRLNSPGFGRPPTHPELNIDNRLIDACVRQMSAFREAVGPDVGLHLDVNFNYKLEGYKRLATALEPVNLTWLEIDTYEAEGLARIRQSTSTPIASLESIYGRRNFRPFLEARAVDIAIIDPMWNGAVEAVKMAAMADSFEVNVAPHNFCGHLQTLIGAHFAAAIPNFRVLELDVDQAPWLNDFFTHPPVIEKGDLVLPTRPGWGTDINEEALKAHPPNKAA